MVLENRTGVGSAGRSGPEVRSDLRVQVATRSAGGLELSLKSKVEPYYGDAIREQVRSLCKGLGLLHAKVEVDDAGAVPFVIAARLEAAVRAAGAGAGHDVRPPRLDPLPPPSSKTRVRRSRLYLPGNEAKFMLSAGLHGPDGVILDLEDSVHPAAKDEARLVVRNALRQVDFGACERMVRINQLPLGLEDLAAVVPESPDLILIPKVETAAQVEAVDRAVAGLLGSDARPLWLMPIIESALGVENAFAIARAASRVAALTIGLEDYTADLGVVKTATGDETLWARARLVNAAHAAGVQAIDSVFGDFGDEAGLRAWALKSRAMGFEGMGCIHPRQIPIIHECFAPSAAEIERAKKIVAAFKEAEAKGVGVVNLGSKMIDPPVVERARRLVAAAEAMGLLAKG
ncbi:MAG: citrate lyase ACP [Deltaproteobacteria bacterium]|nr:citrate lyase ACP [Deltaproteobacteria bacterium]